MRSISKELAKRHEVVVYTTTALDFKHDSSPREKEVDGYRITYFPRILKPLCYSGLFGQLNISSSMMKAVRKNLKNFDIVHLHSWQQFPDIIIHYYATRYHVPYVLQVHGSLPRISRQARKWLYDIFFGFRLLKDTSKVVALNQVEAEQYRRMGVLREKIDVIPNGINLSEYGNLPPKGFFRKKFSIDCGARIVLYLGRMHESKGLDLLAQAFKIVSRSFGNVRLVLVGPNDGYVSTFSKLISGMGIEAKVLLTGFVEERDKLAALVDSDVFVTPRFSGFPITFLEACLAGCPIVTASDELDWVHNNVGYVTEDSPIALSNAISEILQNEVVQKKFRNNCRRTIRNFDISMVASQLENTYRSIVEGKPRYSQLGSYYNKSLTRYHVRK